MIGSNGNPERVGQSVWVPEVPQVLFASFLIRIRALPGGIGSLLLYFQLRDRRTTDAMRAGAVG